MPDRALQNIDELDLLQRIYAVVGPASGLDKLVNEEKPYLVSRIVGVEDFGKTYAARFTLHALEDAQKWKAVINHCRAAMVKCDDDENMTPIRLMDDSQLWTSLVDATIALDDEGLVILSAMQSVWLTQNQSPCIHRQDYTSFPRRETAITQRIGS